jgi:hypothetical protein
MCQELTYAREGFIHTPWGRLWSGIAATGMRPPLLTLHGGPGVPHYHFMRSIGELADERPVIFAEPTPNLSVFGEHKKNEDPGEAKATDAPTAAHRARREQPP